MSFQSQVRKFANADFQFDQDLTTFLINPRRSAHRYAVGDVVFQPSGAGQFWRCQSAGTTHRDPTPFEFIDDQVSMIRDGDVVWERTAPGSGNLPTLTVAWSIDGNNSGSLAVTNSTVDQYRVKALITGGNDGAFYQVRGTVTLSTGAEFTLVIDVQIRTS